MLAVGPHQIRLQAYMVPFVTDVAAIFGTQIACIFDPYQDSTHIWALSLLKLHAYLVNNEMLLQVYLPPIYISVMNMVHSVKDSITIFTLCRGLHFKLAI